MANPDNPGLIPYHAEQVAVAVPTVSRDGGYPSGQIADPKVANALGKQSARYVQYLDIGRMAIGDMFSDSIALARDVSISFPTGSGLGPLTPDSFPTVYASGCRIFYSQAILEASNVYSNTFTPNARTYFYGNSPTVGTDQIVQIDVVGLADPPNPPAGFADLGGVETDLTNVTVNIPSTLPSQLLVNADVLFEILNANRAIVDASSLVGFSAVDATGSGDTVAVSVDGNGDAGALITTTGARGLTVSNDDPTSSTVVITNTDPTGPALTVVSGSASLLGDQTTIGLSGADALTVESTATLQAGGSVNSTLNMNATLAINGVSGGALGTDAFTVCSFNGTTTLAGRTNVAATTSTTTGDISIDAGSTLQFRDGVSTQKVHFSPDGWVRGHGQADTIATDASAQLETDTAVAPRVAADLDISCQFWVQRAVTGTIIISINELGVGQVGTSQTLQVNTTGGNNWTIVNFSRTRVAADTSPFVYELDVQGNGSDVTVHEARISVLPTV